MDCTVNQEKLIEFHFGNMDIESRTQMESHLLSCPDCLQEFFLLKRDTESAHALALRPSSQVKHKISHEFAAYSHAQIQEQQKQRWLQTHPKKLVWGGLAAAAALIFVLVAGQNGKLNELIKIDQAPKAEMVRSLHGTVDSGGNNPGHINII